MGRAQPAVAQLEDSKPASTSRFQIVGSWSIRAPKRSIRCPPVIFVYSPKSLATWPMASSPSGVISPPGMRGTTEYEPSFCISMKAETGSASK